LVNLSLATKLRHHRISSTTKFIEVMRPFFLVITYPPICKYCSYAWICSTPSYGNLKNCGITRARTSSLACSIAFHQRRPTPPTPGSGFDSRAPLNLRLPFAFLIMCGPLFLQSSSVVHLIRSSSPLVKTRLPLRTYSTSCG
jgi:hypothetical protein